MNIGIGLNKGYELATKLRPDSSLYFDGVDDYAVINFGYGLNPFTQKIRLEMRVKPTNTNRSSLIFATENGSFNRFYVANFEGYWTIGLQGNSYIRNGFVVEPKWVDIIFEAFEGVATLWVDGVIAVQSNYTSYTLLSDFQLSRPTTRFQGLIQKFKIFVDEELRIDMPMTEGYGNVLYDHTHQKNNALIYGGTWRWGE